MITFFKTNKPHRYLWLAQLDNERLTKAGGLKIEYNDVAYQAKSDMTITTDYASEYSDLSTLYEEDTFIGHPEYAMVYRIIHCWMELILMRQAHMKIWALFLM